MRGRILIGVGAWLLGAGAATGGSLLAVSLLGQGMTGFSGPQLTGTTVSQALDGDAGETAAAPDPSAPGWSSSAAVRPAPGPTPARARAHQIRKPGSSASAAPSSPPASPASQAATTAAATPGPQQSPAADGTVLTSQGGDVVAACETGGAYLVSWSPQQGWEVDSVNRGPAAQARVVFESATNSVTMTVTCTSGVPTARIGADE